MAVGGSPTIATAAIGLIPVIQGVRGNIASQLAGSGVMSSANSAGKSVGQNFATSAMSAAKTGLKFGGIVAGAIGAVTIKGGFDRALGIEDAQAKMKGLGYDTKSVSKIMDNALSSVEGTSFGLDSAATTAAGAVAAGIKPGKELQGTLTTVANTAAATGGTMDEMGSIFNTVAANGKAYTGDIKMIADRGVPIWQSLGKTLGKTTGEVQKMATEGKISFKDFEAAAKDASGNVAAAMGDTTRGSFANMFAAVKKLGAMFVTGVLPLAKTTFQGIQGLLNAVKDKLDPFVSGFFDKFGGKAQKSIKSFFDTLIAGVNDFDPTPVVDFLGKVGKIGGGVFKEITGGIKAFGAAWKYNDGDITSSGFPGFMEKAAYWLHQFWDSIKGMDLSGVSKIFSSLGTSIKGISLPSGGGAGSGVAGFGESLQSIAQAAPGVLALGLDVLGKALQFVSDNAGTIVKFMPLIVAGLVAWKVHSAATTDALIVQRTMTAQMAPVMVANNGLILLNNILEGKAARQKTVSTLATVRQTAAEKLATGAKKVGAAASFLLGGALKFAMGPIGLVIAGITLLVAGLVWFFTKTKTGQAIIQTVWAGIKTAMSAVVTWFQGTALPIIKAVWNGIAAGALWLYNNAILPAWNGIKTAIGAVVTWAQTSLIPAFQAAWNGISSGALWLYHSVIQPVWTGIKIAIAVVIAVITVLVKGWVALFRATVAPLFLWLYRNVIQPVWKGIKIAISAVVAWFRDTAWPIVKKIIAFFADGFRLLYRNAILPVWRGIRSAISAVVSWFRDTAWPIVKKVIGWLKLSFEGWKIIASSVWRAIKSVIGSVAGWFRDTVWPIISRVIGKLKDGFQGMRDKVSDVWRGIKNKIVSPVVNWFSDTVKPKIDTFVKNVKDGFTGLKDSVVKAWNGIKDGMKKPINGVIGIYNKHIKTPFNTVINKILGGGSAAAKKVQLKEMTPFARGGWTGPGARLQPAGVVHADEFVVKKSSRQTIERSAPGFLDQLNTHGARALSNMGLGYASGGRVLNGYREIESIPHAGVSITSALRKGARTAGTGSVSKHSTGYAVDFAGTAEAMKKFFNFVRDNYKVSELIHTPMGGRQLSRGGIPKANFPAKTAAMHYNHVHVGGYEPGEKQGSAGGGGGLFDNPFSGLWSKIKDTVAEKVGGGAVGGILSGAVEKVTGIAKNFVTDKISSVLDFAGDTWDAAKTGIGKGVGATKATYWATQALTHTGDFNGTNLASLLRRMQQESGMKPDAQNNWDSNAAKGQASRGLMQVIPSTFAAYRDKSLSSNIFDPVANIVASINYTKSRYGSLTAGWNRKGGYAAGGYTGPGARLQPAGIVHADEYVLRSEAQRSISKAAPGFLDRLNQLGAGAIGYAKGGLVGYASGGTVSPTSKIGSTKVTVLLDGLTGTEKQVTSAAGKLADGIVKVFNDRMKAAKTATVNKLSDSLSSLKKQASALKKTVSTTTAKSKKSTIGKLSDELAALKKQKSTLSATAREVSKVTKVTGKTASGKLITKTVTTSTAAAKKAAKDAKAVQKQIDSTQSALTKARRGDYSGAAKAATARLKAVEKEIAATDKALKAARRGDYQNAAMLKGTKAYNRYAAGAVTRLESYAARADTLTAKLKTANTSLSDAQKLWQDYRSSMVEKFQGTYALSEESATTGIETIIRGFKNGAATVKTFTGQLAQLKSKGLSGGLIDQIAQMGAESGSKVAKNLLTGTDSQIKQITSQYNALNKASTSSGTSLADQMYRNGVNSAKGLVKGLESQLASVEKASEALANKVLSTVRKKLDIHSPSRVMAQQGEYTGEGFILGVRSMTPAVQSSIEAMVAPPSMAGLRDVGRPDVRPAVPALPSSSAIAGTAGGPAIQIGDVYGLSAEDVAREIQKKEQRRMALYA